MRTLHIITGASRGLGAAMAEQGLRSGARVLAMSRHALESLEQIAPARLEWWGVDLADPLPVARRLEEWLHAQGPSAYEEVALINNAGLLSGVGPVDEQDDEAVVAALRVGLEAPVLLTRAFLRATRTWTARCKVLHISSGLGRFAMAGSAVYGATKAGLDNHARGVALDEAHRGRGARIVALSPGEVDTDMQARLRAAGGPGFPDHALFVRLHATGRLASPRAAAARVLAHLARPDYGREVIVDL